MKSCPAAKYLQTQSNCSLFNGSWQASGQASWKWLIKSDAANRSERVPHQMWKKPTYLLCFRLHTEVSWKSVSTRRRGKFQVPQPPKDKRVAKFGSWLCDLSFLKDTWEHLIAPTLRRQAIMNMHIAARANKTTFVGQTNALGAFLWRLNLQWKTIFLRLVYIHTAFCSWCWWHIRTVLYTAQWTDMQQHKVGISWGKSPVALRKMPQFSAQVNTHSLLRNKQIIQQFLTSLTDKHLF